MALTLRGTLITISTIVSAQTRQQVGSFPLLSRSPR